MWIHGSGRVHEVASALAEPNDRANASHLTPCGGTRAVVGSAAHEPPLAERKSRTRVAVLEQEVLTAVRCVHIAPLPHDGRGHAPTVASAAQGCSGNSARKPVRPFRRAQLMHG